MKITRYLYYCILCSVQLIFLLGCSKKDFLDTKPNDSLIVPETLSEFQALLDNDNWMNGSSLMGYGGPNPSMGEISSDNIYVAYSDYEQYPLFLKNVYTWQKDIYEQGSVLDWNNSYRTVFYSNVALDGIQSLKVNSDEQEIYNNVKGSALFFRAHTFYQLAQVFAPPYQKETANTSLGIPLRLTSDINVASTRSALNETYAQIIKDLKNAVELLPKIPKVKTRPSKAAVYGLLARVFQTMGDYDQSLLYADSCLLMKNDLLDYNNLTATYYPIPVFNDEVIFSTLMQFEPSWWIYPTRIDSTLYKTYSESDLRKSLFFMDAGSGGGKVYWGSYDGSSIPFSGLATDEIYLIKAECLARKGETMLAMATLNLLLKNRFLSGAFVPLTASNSDDALMQILEERRKELIMRGLRWTDLRRLNADVRFSKTLTRVVNGIVYTLLPNDPRYTLPIPNDVISITGLPQNIR